MDPLLLGLLNAWKETPDRQAEEVRGNPALSQAKQTSGLRDKASQEPSGRSGWLCLCRWAGKYSGVSEIGGG